MKSILKSFQWYYEVFFAPFLAQKMRWLFWPLYFLFKKFHICFVVNITSTTGHIVAELDYFFRVRLLNEIDPNKRYVWIKKKDEYSIACMRLYGDKFWWASCSRFNYLFFLPLTMAFPEITFDAGISRLKWQLPKLIKYKGSEKSSTYLHQVSKAEGISKTVDYYKIIAKNPNIFPLKTTKFEENILEFLPQNNKKIALIHFKDSIRNAVALEPDPNSYLKALNYLRDLGYFFIFIGREKMPEIFTKHNIFNYSESRFANFFFDLCLFYLADIAIVIASGVSVLADCMNTHYLYLNSWHLSVPPFSKKSIFVPAVVQDLEGENLSFSEQNKLYQSLADVGPEIFPKDKYKVKNATEEEVFMATKELIALKASNSQISLTPLQQKFRYLDRDAPLFYSQSRCSDFFLQKYQVLFKERIIL